MKVQKLAIGFLTFDPALMPGGVGGDTVVVTVANSGRQVGTFEVPLSHWQVVQRVASLPERVGEVASVTKDKATRAALEKLLAALK